MIEDISAGESGYDSIAVGGVASAVVVSWTTARHADEAEDDAYDWSDMTDKELIEYVNLVNEVGFRRLGG